MPLAEEVVMVAIAMVEVVLAVANIGVETLPFQCFFEI